VRKYSVDTQIITSRLELNAGKEFGKRVINRRVLPSSEYVSKIDAMKATKYFCMGSSTSG